MKLHFFIRAGLSIILFSLSFCVLAESEESSGGFAYLSFGQATLDSDKATQEKITDSAKYLRLAGEGIKNNLMFGGGFSAYFYSDNADFSQYVQDQFGNQSTANSTADANNLFGEAGYTLNISNNLRMDLLAGYEYIFTSSRSIDNCSNCTKEDINIKSGAYLHPRLSFQSTKDPSGFLYEVGLSYAKSFTGDVKNVLMLTLGFGGM